MGESNEWIFIDEDVKMANRFVVGQIQTFNNLFDAIFSKDCVGELNGDSIFRSVP